ncbi:DNA polymerase III subunit chi [Magnetovibrio sp. PR-2]|uniref:DNA polymerase III subunit chi n=1 Tax=Magnetovibrio sp. PR-2 TaxID=3120356 RepID=UPI002FCE0AF2
MTQIAFYHLTRSPLEAALPKLLEKTLEAGKRAVVVAGSVQRVEHLNGALWTYDAGAWLAHGSAKDGYESDQPVWLTDSDDNPNEAQFLFLTDGAAREGLENYERCFELFDGANPDMVKQAREKWKAYKDAGHELTYWQQTEQGGWSKKET